MSNPNTAQYPGVIVTDPYLPPATNSFSTTLTSTIDSLVTTIPILTNAGLNVPCLVRIDSEIILATGSTSNTLTGCTRAFNGTTASAHTSNAVISAYIFAFHFNQLAAEMKAIENFLGINGSNIILSGQNASGNDLIGNYPAPSLKVIPGLTPGTYSNADITVDSNGRVTLASSGPNSVANVVYRAAVAQNGVAVLGFNIPSDSPPSAVIYNAAQTLYAVAQFSTTNYVEDHFIVPATYTGTVTATIRWRAVAITGNVNWNLSFIGINAGSSLDTNFASAGSAVVSPYGTTLGVVQTTITGFDISSLSANEDCFFKLSRSTSGDTMSGVAELISVRITLS